MTEFQNYIDGKFVAGGAGRISVANPANSQIVGEQALADAGDVAETIIAHQTESPTERAYNRTDFLEQRRELMEAWERNLADCMPLQSD